MMMYRLLNKGVLKLSTNECIPDCDENYHWKEYLKWRENGNIPDPQYSLDDYKNIKISEVNGMSLKLCCNSNDVDEWDPVSIKKYLKAVRVFAKTLKEKIKNSDDPNSINIRDGWPVYKNEWDI